VWSKSTEATCLSSQTQFYFREPLHNKEPPSSENSLTEFLLVQHWPIFYGSQPNPVNRSDCAKSHPNTSRMYVRRACMGSLSTCAYHNFSEQIIKNTYPNNHSEHASSKDNVIMATGAHYSILERSAKGHYALGKAFAERSFGIVLIGKGCLCRAPRGRLSAKALPRATSALGKG